ncbi:hypothetical protein CARUB_v10028004mg, partial [Capsella rubella]
MSRDSKGRAWYDKFYRKLETILVEVDSFASQLYDYITCNDDTFVSPSGIYTGVSHLIPSTTEIQAAHVEDRVASTRSFSSNSMKVVNNDEFFIEDFDVGPLETIDLYDMTSREDPSDFDNNLLYATRDRTKQLRSFK